MPAPRPPLALAALAIVMPAALHAQAADPAAQAIAAYDDGVIAVMKARLPLTGRIDRFTALVTRAYDMPAIAALVTGPKWAEASAPDRAAATAALTRHSAVSLARNFKR